ncbi:exonuclease domain-containing protein [Labilibacter marinus]|uniref:exonuclease domain-containing protein n=1 Tax=Labilibacter marinus TaxID=1477105 RepID=UPI00082AFCF9|nr:exonuclease domain-containing protein [Labilibacter marinus]
MYTIIDIETTGGNFNNGKITEVAIYLHDGNKVVDEFVSLINPEQFIPAYITQLTGITNEMVADAPKFYEVARQIVDITEGTVFVAHNASFDYGFIKAEFESLGYGFDRETLCTVKLSRKLLPGHKSYSLGNICEVFGISNDARHRAAGDALATIELFEILLEKNGGVILPMEGNGFFSIKGLHPKLDIEKVKQLPASDGVYYLYNDKNDLVYIGKSKNIKQRVLTHLGNPKAQKAVRMKQEVASVDFVETGSELLALLKESAEIKKNKPIYNVAQRKNRFHFGLFSFKDRKGYARFNIAPNDGRVTPLASFDSLKSAKDFLFQKVEDFNLCQKLSGLNDSTGACFQYQLKTCDGACVGQESSEQYNSRVETLIEQLAYRYKDFVIVDKGRDLEELSVVVVKDGKYQGFGWVEKDLAFDSMDEVSSNITLYDDNQDARIIINRYLKDNPKLKVIQF